MPLAVVLSAGIVSRIESRLRPFGRLTTPSAEAAATPPSEGGEPCFVVTFGDDRVSYKEDVPFH